MKTETVLNRTALLPEELSVEKLKNPCDPASLPFTSTKDLPALESVIGQPRALRALELGSEVTGLGYNIFALGLPDSGRTTLTHSYLRQKAEVEPAPDDWCYVNNFNDPREPHVLRMPAGNAIKLRKEMQNLVEAARSEIPRVFMSDEYTREHDRLVGEMKLKLEKELHQLEDYVNRYNYRLIKTPYGLFLGPAMQGKLLRPEDFEKLSDEQREKLRQLQEKLSEVMEKALARMRLLQQTTSEEINDLNQRTSLYVVEPLINRLKEKFTGIPAAIGYLDRVQVDIVNNAAYFRIPDEQKRAATGGSTLLEEKAWAVRYQVNVIVDNTEQKCAPVITENQPTYHNLLGAIDHELVLGASRTDFTMIRSGALHRANGGYLIVPARDILVNHFTWEGLKRVLRDGEIRILELGGQIGLVSNASLKPEPIPLNVKVIMVGTPLLYYLLRAYDEDFAKLFKVRAEFATYMARNADCEREYGLFVKSVVDENHLLPFDSTAVARIIEYGSRLAEDQEKLSARFGIITDLIRESGYWAKKKNKAVVDATSVQAAIDERIFRSNLIEERIQEMIKQDALFIDVDGEAVGQVNALSVISLGDYAFGRPNRVTASVYTGQAGVVDIERQAKLGGPIHTKGVLIISGYLGEHYGRYCPLSLTAYLAFEQSYDEVEGDSASAAELLALLSAVAGIPLKQSLAITGSINQHGIIQPIGGVNEKIEGFFDVCQQIGLTGRQGVMIPEVNCRNLMLKQAVIDAVRQGKFHIWPIHSIADAILLATGQEPGEIRPDGTYPPDTFGFAVLKQLKEFARLLEPKQATRRRSKTEDLQPQAA